jgi:hypothetical protein
LPAISFVATTYYLQTGDLIKVIRWLFSRKKKELQEKYSQIPKNYGRVAIPITIALFFIGGAITGFWVDHFWPHVYRYLAVGAVWGVAWYQMLNKNYVHHGDM